MSNVAQSGLTCPSCGHDDFNPEKQCTCGYQADESFMIESFIMQSDKKGASLMEDASEKTVTKSARNKAAKEVVLKEIDSWIISYLAAEKAICLGTPALQSFRLKLELKDLEELIDVLYHMTGQEKTTRKLSLAPDEINELLKEMYIMIEEKKSKMAITFSEDEVQNMADMINSKLKESNK